MNATFVVVALFAFVPALLPSLAVTRSPWRVLALAPVLTALCAGMAGVVAVALRIPTYVPFAVIAAATNVAAVRVLRHRDAQFDWRAQFLPGAVVLVAVGCAFLPIKRWAIDFDTQTLWFAHGRWFFRGGDYVWRMLPNPAFGNADYPPLTPALVGLLWRMQGRVDPRSGQLLIGVANFGAVSLVALAFPGLFPRRLGAIATAAGVLVAAAVIGFAGPFATDGYADLLWAACLGAAVLYLLLAPRNFENVMVGAIALAAAALTKNEGTAAALVVGVLAVVRHRRRWRSAPGLLLFFPLALCWPVLLRIHGVHGEYEPATVWKFVTGDPAVWNHLSPTVSAMWRYVGVSCVVAVVCSAAGLLAANRTRVRERIASTAYAWAAITATSAIIAFGYMIDALPLAPTRTNPVTLGDHLAASVDRTTIAIRLLLLVETIIWALCALLAVRQHLDRRADDAPASASSEPARAATSDQPRRAVPRMWGATSFSKRAGANKK